MNTYLETSVSEVMAELAPRDSPHFTITKFLNLLDTQHVP
jgi:hypothetical protein